MRGSFTVSRSRRTVAQIKAGAVVEQADRICEGKFDLLGFTNLSFGDPIDWHFEPVSGKRIPLLHWSKLDYLDAGVAGDKEDHVGIEPAPIS